MSNAVFPTLAGLAFNVTRNPVWATQVRNASSGRQYTLSKRIYPLWHFKLPFEVLRAAGSWTEWQTLVGFINARRGRYDDFLYLDPRDNAAVNETFGIGDGVTTTFPLTRTLGGFVEPVGGCVTGGAVIKVDGTARSVTFSADWSQVTFASAPAAASVLTWSGQFYFRCRFMQDEISFEQFLQDMYSAKSVEFQSFRP
jgi:uncharacterized protein (TIGR02217 family)